jgi:hypothetical protein
MSERGTIRLGMGSLLFGVSSFWSQSLIPPKMTPKPSDPSIPSRTTPDNTKRKSPDFSELLASQQTNLD